MTYDKTKWNMDYDITKWPYVKWVSFYNWAREKEDLGNDDILMMQGTKKERDLVEKYLKSEEAKQLYLWD